MAPAEGKQDQGEARTGPPAWLDAAFIEEALRNAGQPQKVAGLTTKHATAPGDHYCSDMFRVKARLASGEEISLILKVLQQEGTFAEVVAKTGVFPVEEKVLGRIVPDLQKLIEEAMPGECPPFAARCLHHGSSPTEFLVLEDLSPAGFRMAKRSCGLGLRHSLLVLRTLARIHASSVALQSQEPGLLEGIPNPWAGEKGEPFAKMCCNNLRIFAETAKTWEDLPGHYVRKIERLVETAFKKTVEGNEPRPAGELNVLVHGDCWINNILFRYGADGGVEGLRLVDFQLSHWASPANDLLYFLYGSLNEEVYFRHGDLLRREYLHELNRSLRALGLGDRQMSWEQLKTAEDACAGYAIFSGFMVFPGVRSDQVFDVEGAMDGCDDQNAKLYTNPVFRKWATLLLPEFDLRGWLDL